MAAKKKAATGVAVVSQYTLEGVPAMLDTVNEKIKKLTGGTDKKPTTQGVDFPNVGQIVNMTKIEDLIMLSATVTTKEAAYKKEVLRMKLAIKTPPFTIKGLTAKAWRDDIEIRITEVAYEDQLKTLNEIKEKLESNLSAEQKFANDMISIQKKVDLL